MTDMKEVNDTMDLFDALPKAVQEVINNSEYGFSREEVKTISIQYAHGVVTIERIVEQMLRYAKVQLEMNSELRKVAARKHHR